MGKTIQIKYPLRTKYRAANVLIFPIMFLIYRLQGFKILHLHWTYPFSFFSENIILKSISTAYVLSFILFVKALGIKIVWTMHNVLPHRAEFLDDKLIYKILTNLVNHKIVHSGNSIKEMDSLGFNTTNTSVIPIGNYVDVYPRGKSLEEARKLFKIPSGAFVLLFFGNILPYKGVDDLIQAVVNLNKLDLYLIIAGKCRDPKLHEHLTKMAKYREKILLNLRYITDEELPNYLNASNVVALPFKRVTTSSSAIMTFSYKRTLIAPRIGDLLDFPEQIGFFYKPTDKSNLTKYILRAYENKAQTKEKGEEAYKYVLTQDWNKSAEGTINVYNSL